MKAEWVIEVRWHGRRPDRGWWVYDTVYKTKRGALAALVIKKFNNPQDEYRVVNTNKKP